MRKSFLWLCALFLICPPVMGEMKCQGESPNGLHRVVAQRDEEGSWHSLFTGDHLVWKAPLRRELPQTVIVSDDGKRFAYLSYDGIELRDGGTGALEAFVEIGDPRLRFDPLRSGWFSGADLLLERASGRLVRLSGDRFSEIPVSQLPKLLSRGECPECCLRVATHYGLELEGSWIAAARASSRHSVREAAAAYAWSRGDRSGGSELGDRPAWRLLVQGDRFDFSDWRFEYDTVDYQLLVPAWMPGLEERALRGLDSKDIKERITAAFILGRMDSPRAVPALYRASASKDAKVRSQVCYSLVMLQGAQAAPEFCRRLEKTPEFGWLFCHVPYPEAVPKLIKNLGKSPYPSQLALKFQTRIDFGEDAQAWERWLALRGQLPRCDLLAGESSGPLWACLQRPDEPPGQLARQPRLLLMVSSELWGAGEDGLISLTNDSLIRREGDNRTSEYAWDLATGKATGLLPASGSRERFAASRDGRVVVVEQADDFLEVHRDGRPPERLKLGRLGCLSPDGKWLAGTESVANLETGERIPRVRSQGWSFEGWRFDRNSRRLGKGVWGLNQDGSRKLVWEGTKRLAIHETAGDRRVADLKEMDFFGMMNGPRISSLDQILVLGAHDRMQIYDWNGNKLATLQGEPAGALTFSPDGRLLAVQKDGDVLVYDTRTFQVRYRLPGRGRGMAMAFSPNNRLLALNDPGRSGNKLCVWELEPGSQGPDENPQLTTELWTGRRLQGGMAVDLTPEEFASRKERWEWTHNRRWLDGPPIASAAAPRVPVENYASALAIVGLLALWWRLPRKSRFSFAN